MRQKQGSWHRSSDMDADYQPGEKLRGGRFVVRALHGRGGMSVVYRAEQRVTWRQKRAVALKVASPSGDASVARAAAEERLAREALLLRLIDHWRVPRPLAAFRERGRAHLAMELAPGRSLEHLLSDAEGSTTAPWPEPRVVALGRALAELLEALHTGPTPILVRDLKPSNLIVTPGGHVMLVDFGIACRLERGERAPESVRGLGTRGYAAPEQCSGGGYEDERVDLYALGAVLYRVATGQSPARTARRFRLPPARAYNPRLSPRLEALLADLVRPDPAERLPSAALVSQILAGWGSTRAVAATPRRLAVGS
jgi:eukaryotic-like serine/threonine-protein kinase